MSIDYGMGTTNIDRNSGIRYGVISQNSVLQMWADSSEGDYGEATCPKCGNAAVEFDSDEHGEHEQYARGCADYACEHCEITFDSSEAFPEEPHGYSVDDGEYVAESCLDSDVMVIKSPFYTFAPFCSPCVPGAGNLNDAAHYQAPLAGEHAAFPQTYCFGHDWFDDGVAPYPIYGVVSERECFPDSWYGR